VVPLEIELPPGKRVVLLSGPNAGGKSVALKTVGVCLLLAQSGWDVPAREDTQLPLVDKVFVDLGDEQSIEKSLSSFSAHLGNLLQFLQDASAATLVLCDEIGSGTDPQEGTALAFAVLEGLAARGATVLASTHFGLLKAAVHDDPVMINAAMDYDEESLRPLFNLRLGDPGSSHAFDIAARWGFPSSLLERARSLVGEERFQIERLLNELGNRARSLAQTESRMKDRENTQRELVRELEQKLTDLQTKRAQLLEETRREGEYQLQEGRRLIERTVRELRSGGAEKETIRRAKETLDKLQSRLPRAQTPAAPAELKPGQTILIPHLGLQGRIIQVRGDRILAETEGIRLSLSRQGIALPETEGAPAPAEVSPPQASWRWGQTPPEIRHEIDLRGQRVAEAWNQLDRLIDRAIPAGLEEILVIHGIGTGKLRQYLWERLAEDPRVYRSQEAPTERGGFGATVVHLARD
jgi:DNA mismatch repair protein MutS2